MKVDKSRSPYFDDHDESKKYHDVLFLPARAVQVRELNNLQTLFYEQIGRLSDHIFEEGSIVIPGETNYDLEYAYVQCNVQNLETIVGQLGAQGIKLQGRTSDVLAEARRFVSPQNSDPSTFYVKYVRGSSNGESSAFTTGEIIDIINPVGAVIGVATVIATGYGSTFSTASGVYYLNRRFVLVDQQSILIEKYNNTPSKSVGFLYNEVVVTSTEDGSLVDNAQGSFNFTAPGADRLQVNTTLHTIDLTDLDSAPENYIEIFRIDNGVVQKYTRGPQYNILNDVLAERTYEQSGDYTVNSFGIALREHLDDGQNSGVYDVTEGGDENKFVTQIEKGLAYVRGYRVENLSTLNIDVDKARNTQILNNSSISTPLGFYIVAESPNVIPNTNELQEITFYSGGVVTPGSIPGGTVLGSARIRFVRRDGTNYRLYLFDVKDSGGNRTTSFLSGANIVYSSAGVPFTANLVSGELFDTSSNSLVFPLNVEFVRSLYDNIGASDSSFTAVKQLSGFTDSNGMVTFTSAPNEVFVSQDSTLAFAAFTDDQTIVEVAGNFSLGGSPLGTTITLDYGASNNGKAIRANLVVAKESVVQKTKSVATHTVTGNLTGNRLSLNRADAFELISVIDDDGINITDQFTLVSNKRPSFYDVSYIEGIAANQPITAEFRFFQHSSGDFFGADSYPDLEYDNIPSEDGRRLSDVIDFRPRIANSGTSFTGTGSSVGNLPVPYSIVRNDVEHYLPRTDKVYVNFKGEFGVKKGVPSIDPKPPEDPSQSMIIYTLNVPAYTFNASDIQVEKINNRRYTMKDIGRLENRISNLEYYVSLDSLERDAESQQILDSDTGLNRFKNGFMVDSFVDHSVGDFSWGLYRVSVGSDGGFGSLRPELSINSVDLEINLGASTGVVVNNGIVTLPFTNQDYINQNQITSWFNVNPFPSQKWIGNIRLSPQSDSWFDVNYIAPDISFKLFNNDNINEMWNAWSLYWTGVPTKNTKERLTLRKGGSDWSESHSSGWQNDITTNSETTATANTDVVQDRIIDKSVVPYMRETDIQISGEGNKPRTRMHFFFDGRNIDNMITPNGGVLGAPVITSASGQFSATFTIGLNSISGFRTGEKIMVVCDDPTGSRTLSTSYGETLFVVSGTKIIRQQNIVSTRNTPTQTTQGWVDPVAQSFSVDVEGGCFITGIDLRFRQKDSDINSAISVEVREMENGRPSNRYLPGTKSTLRSSDITVSNDGNEVTTFEFDYPVYLQDGTEYCFVVTTNSSQFVIYKAEYGAEFLDNNKVAAPVPNVGVLFKAQGLSAWKEDTTSIAAFSIHKALFNVATGGLVELVNTDIRPFRLQQNAFQTTSGSSQLIVLRDKHNYVEGASVVITDASGGNGINAAEINGTHEIVEVLDPGRFVIEVASNGAVNGRIGGSNCFISNMYQASLVQPNITDIQFQDTSIEYQFKGTTGKSIDGIEAPYQDTAIWTNVENKENFALNRPILITNRLDEQENFGNNRTMRIRAGMSSTNPNISPIIDLNGASIIVPCYMTDYKQSLQTDGSNTWSNYRGNIIVLNQPATALKVFMDVSRPPGSDAIVTARFGNSIEEVRESEWVEVDGINTVVTGGNDYVENEYGLEGLSEYTTFQIMIQLKSQSSVNVSKCRRLRAIALGT